MACDEQHASVGAGSSLPAIVWPVTLPDLPKHTGKTALVATVSRAIRQDHREWYRPIESTAVEQLPWQYSKIVANSVSRQQGLRRQLEAALHQDTAGRAQWHSDKESLLVSCNSKLARLIKVPCDRQMREILTTVNPEALLREEPLERQGWHRRGSQHIFSRATSFEVTMDNVQDITSAGRTRWCVGNEAFNTPKNQGYEFEQNYGHGKQFLSSTLAGLMMLALGNRRILFKTWLSLLKCPGRSNRGKIRI